MSGRRFSFDSLSSFYIKHEYAFVLFFVLIWQLSLIAVSGNRFLETDNYTHALRLMDFIQSGSWREILYLHDNCPFGQILHFTRLTDMFLFVTTLPFLPFFELKQAVLYGGFLYNPVIALLSAAALIRAGKAFFSPFLRATGTFFYFVQGPVLSSFLAGRPDHHVLLNLLLIVLCGHLMYGMKTQKIVYYKAAGIFGGLAVWSSPEGLLAGVFILGGMVPAWLGRCQNIRQIRIFSQFFFISTTVCWIVNPPMQGFFYPDNGRLSFLMAVVLGLAYLSFHIEEVLEKKRIVRSFPSRFLSLLLLTLISVGAAVLLFGTKALFSSPIPPEIRSIWADHISELQSCLDNIFDSPAVIPLSVLLLGTIVYPRSSGQMRKLIIINGIPVLLFAVLIVLCRRFARPAAVFMVFLLLPVLHVYYQNFHLEQHASAAIKKIFILFMFFFYIVALLISFQNQKEMEASNVHPENYAPYLLRQPENGCLLTTNASGPETAWTTGRRVIGSPYHSNAQGIVDNYTVLNSTDMTVVRELLKKRSVSEIVLPNLRNKKRDSQKGASGTQIKEDTFPSRLILNGEPFCFLKPVTDVPENINEKYLIYHVDFVQCGEE